MLRNLFARLAVAGLLLGVGVAEAANCPVHYLGGKPPAIQQAKLAASTTELCYGVFGVMHSGVTRTPLWSAEYLRADNLERASGMKRKDSFHPEPLLAKGKRAELADYSRSGFDRGHLAPNAHMPDRRTQHESFSLANMVPQDRDQHSRYWTPIELAVRKMAKSEGSLYVISGPAFLGDRLRKVGNVIVPSHMYKVVYSPRQKLAAAWFIENQPDAKLNVIPVAELERIIGIELLPALTTKQKERMLALPKIKAGKRRSN